MSEDEDLREIVLDFLKAYYNTNRNATFHREMKKMKEAVEYDDRVWGVRVDTGEWTHE
jgi:hypothetical protein